jgi:hypothetical protein
MSDNLRDAVPPAVLLPAGRGGGQLPPYPLNGYCSPLRVEKHIFKFVVGLSTLGKVALSTASVGLAVVTAVFPLLWVKEATFDEAKETCLRTNMQLRDENPSYSWLGDVDVATAHLLPRHYINSVAVLVSLVHFLIWTWFSTHRNQAADLDRTRECYFVLSLHVLYKYTHSTHTHTNISCVFAFSCAHAFSV